MTGLMREMTGLEKLRELAEAIKQGEDRKAIAWVREHGGIAYVKEEWNARSNLKRMCEKERAKVERQQRHIEFVQGKCRERQEHICDLNELKRAYVDALNGVCKRLGLTDGTGLPDMPEVIWAELDRRLMPEGMEWPIFEDGEPVKFGDVVSDGDETGRVYYVTFDTVNPVIIGFTDETPDQDPGTWLEVSVNDGERVKRPERKDSRPDGCCHPGSYECDELAFRDQNSGEDVYADKCLVPELRRLRESGIRTLGSCCGHGTTRPNIVVAPECEGAMRRQGYEGRRNKFGVLEFAAKSSCPAPKVLDADGVEIRVGDTVCGTRDMEPMRVVDTDSRECGFKHIKCEKEGDGFWFYCPDELTHKLPILAADGKPLREGETVYLQDGESFTVDFIRSDGNVAVRELSSGMYLRPERLTHERPIADSWERLEEDATLPAATYCERMGIADDGGCSPEELMARDLVRRAKKLAGVSDE